MLRERFKRRFAALSQFPPALVVLTVVSISRFRGHSMKGKKS